MSDDSLLEPDNAEGGPPAQDATDLGDDGEADRQREEREQGGKFKPVAPPPD